ncbi:MAG: 50S ribosomal protein L23 [Clostridia bacterium]|nr:MAG: 50S ribosomal protein L23 [Clostridia bacterium]
MYAQDVILRPVITEKSTRLMEDNKYTFYVHPQATKIDIRRAAEELFQVRVLEVRTMRVPGKTRRVGKFSGRTPNRKKAIIKLAPGDRIEIFEGL